MARLPLVVIVASLTALPATRPILRANGTITGRIDLRVTIAPVAPRPNVADLGTPPPHDPPDLRHSVVYLEPAPQEASEGRESGRAVMNQRNETFVPHVLAITVGTTVDFPNSDPTFHNVFSLSRTRPFDLGRYAAGHSKSVRFDRPGIVRVFCDIHSHMSAFILVFDHRFFSVTDDEGRYRIDDVPAGTYTLAVWNEVASQTARPVTVPPDGGVVTVNFSIGGG